MEPVDALIGHIARRDGASFERLFKMYAPRLKTYFQKGGASGALSDEMVQEVMLSIWRNAERFDAERASANTWIYSIARNRLIDSVRRTKRIEVDIDDPALVISDGTHLEEQTDLASRVARVKKAMNSLPNEQAEVVRAAYFEDMSLAEIAEARSQPLGTVKTRARLALGKLRSALSEEELA